jgi:nucleoside-diphosphate-sugar epimerase
MRVLVTGSAGHLGEALVRTLQARGDDVAGLDLLESPFTHHVGSVADAAFVRECTRGADVVMHTATLHKPHVGTHTRHAFVETNVVGTLAVLEAALANRVASVIFTSTTSTFGSALRPAEGQPAAWVDETVAPVPRNIYGVTKTAAEDLCELFHRTRGLPCLVLRTSRFFPEADDDADRRRSFDDLNLKVNEYLHRRLDVADAVDAHLLAADRAVSIGFGRYVVSATSPFERRHLRRLRTDTPGVVRELYPDYEEVFDARGWRMLDGIDRVYVNQRAQDELGWRPRYTFGSILEGLRRGEDVFSPLARTVGSKGYHAERFEHGPYPIEGET